MEMSTDDRRLSTVDSACVCVCLMKWLSTCAAQPPLRPLLHRVGLGPASGCRLNFSCIYIVMASGEQTHTRTHTSGKANPFQATHSSAKHSSIIELGLQTTLDGDSEGREDASLLWLIGSCRFVVVPPFALQGGCMDTSPRQLRCCLALPRCHCHWHFWI